MKSETFVKKIDELGRIVVPKEVRKILGVTNLDCIQFMIESDQVVVKKHTQSCCICSASEELLPFKDKYICQNCKNELKNA